MFGSSPRLNAKKFKNVEQGIEIVKVKAIETTGITISKMIGKIYSFINIKLRRMLKTPIANAVNNAKDNVANTFSNHDFLLNSPIIKSREVLAINGPLKLPLRESKAGTIKINKRKLSNETINRDSTIPARISPTMETISEGNVSLTILPLVS